MLCRSRICQITERYSIEAESLDAAWKSLPDYMDGQNTFVVEETQVPWYEDYGDNNLRPIEVVLSLGI